MAESKDIGTDANMNQQLSLILPADRVKLKDLLCQRLSECGWRDEVRLMCHNMLTERGGSTTQVRDMIAAVTPQARSLVPKEVKQEMLLKIREFVSTDTKNSPFFENGDEEDEHMVVVEEEEEEEEVVVVEEEEEEVVVVEEEEEVVVVEEENSEQMF